MRCVLGSLRGRVYVGFCRSIDAQLGEHCTHAREPLTKYETEKTVYLLRFHSQT